MRQSKKVNTATGMSGLEDLSQIVFVLSVLTRAAASNSPVTKSEGRKGGSVVHIDDFGKAGLAVNRGRHCRRKTIDSMTSITVSISQDNCSSSIPSTSGPSSFGASRTSGSTFLIHAPIAPLFALSAKQAPDTLDDAQKTLVAEKTSAHGALAPEADGVGQRGDRSCVT